MKRSFLYLLVLVLTGLAVFPGQAQTVRLEVEPNHSTVGFAIPIAGFSLVRGTFREYTIFLNYVDGDLTRSSVEAAIKVASIDTDIEGRDEHLRTADFFDAEQYPEITFKSNRILPFEDGYLAIGEFSMHGISKEVYLPFTVVKTDGNTLGIRIRSKLNRLEYGVGAEFQHTSIPDFLGEMIDVEIDFWTRKAK